MNFLYFFLSKNCKKTRIFDNEFNFRKKLHLVCFDLLVCYCRFSVTKYGFLKFCQIKSHNFCYFLRSSKHCRYISSLNHSIFNKLLLDSTIFKYWTLSYFFGISSIQICIFRYGIFSKNVLTFRR